MITCLDVFLVQGFDRVSTISFPEVKDLPQLSVPSAEEMEQMEQASATVSEVTSTMLQQRIQLEEKNRTVQMLQKALVGSFHYNIHLARVPDQTYKGHQLLPQEYYWCMFLVT